MHELFFATRLLASSITLSTHSTHSHDVHADDAEYEPIDGSNGGMLSGGGVGIKLERGGEGIATRSINEGLLKLLSVVSLMVGVLPVLGSSTLIGDAMRSARVKLDVELQVSVCGCTGGRLIKPSWGYDMPT